VITHDSQRQHLFGAELAVPPMAWAHAVDVVIAPMIGNIGRPGMQFRTRAAIRDVLLRNRFWRTVRAQKAGWLTWRSV
jgi:hypothetical protein